MISLIAAVLSLALVKAWFAYAILLAFGMPDKASIVLAAAAAIGSSIYMIIKLTTPLDDIKE